MGEAGYSREGVKILSDIMYGAAIGLTDLDGKFDLKTIEEKALKWVLDYDPKNVSQSLAFNERTLEIIENYKRNPTALVADIIDAKIDMLNNTMVIANPAEPGTYLAVMGQLYDGVYKVASGIGLAKP